MTATTPATPTSYYRPLGGGRYQPTIHTQGAWQDWEQHMAPVAGLLAHAIECHAPRPDLQLTRISYDILGNIRSAVSEVTCHTVRPGRTIELVEAVLTIEGKVVVRASGWRLSIQDTTRVAGGFPADIPPPDALQDWRPSDVWDGGYIASLEARTMPGSQVGRGTAWVRTPITLIEGIDVSPVAAFVGLVDTANGIAVREDPQEWMFPNVDLTIHLYRTPVPGWVGFQTAVAFGEQGVGLTTSRLFDVRGPVGRAEQILTVRRMPGSPGEVP